MASGIAAAGAVLPHDAELATAAMTKRLLGCNFTIVKRRPATVEITTKRLAQWDDIHRYATPGWLYRGHPVADWVIQSSIERVFFRENTPPAQRRGLEWELLRDFKRAYHHYTLHLPDDASLIEWLALMEHHGAPTRFVDFSYSIYVAAYFALETAEEDSAVWAINGPWASKASVASLRRARKKGVESFLKPTVPAQEEIAARALFNAPIVRCAVPLNPFRLNERLRTQRGIFMVPGDVTVPFMDNLRALPQYGSASNVVKLIIPLELRRTALRQLYHMNVSHTSLFPGLDGYARSLGVYHPSFDPVKW